MAPHVQLTHTAVVITRSRGESVDDGASEVTTVPLDDIEQVLAIPASHRSSSYLVLEAKRAPKLPLDRNPLAVRFDGRARSEADRMCRLIDHAVRARRSATPEQLVTQQRVLETQHRWARLATLSAYLTLAGMLLPIVAVVIVVALFLLLK